jgi:hypothetical protein
VGFVVGVVVGLTGVGGGSLMTPMLVFVFGISPLTAVGTDLLFAAITKAIGVAAHGFRGQVNWRVFRHLSAGSLPAAILAIFVLALMSNRGYALEGFVLTILGFALLGTAAAVMYRHNLRRALLWSTPQLRSIPAVVRAVAVGAVLGVLVSFTSVGAGAMGVAGLMLIYPRMAPAKIVGTDLAHALPLVTIAGLGHLHLGNVNYPLLVSLLIGSIPGIWIGTMLSSKLPAVYMRRILVGVLVTVGVVCIWR